jgi:hypothetical protein
MTDDTQQTEPENDFAKFEADAKAAEPPAEEARTEEAADDTLELGGEEAPELTEEQKAEEAAKKERSRPWSKRVDILTARNAEKDRRIAELEAKLAGQEPAPTLDEVMAKEPKEEDYEFGKADPDYQEARQDWKLEVRDAKKRADEGEAKKKNYEHAAVAEVIGKLEDGLAAAGKAGAEKYEDFEEKIAEAVEARGGEPMPPLLNIGIAVSPVGADITYRLATDPATAEKIEKLATTNVPGAAVALGELEGEFLPADNDDADLNLADPLDMLRLNGRMKARLAGKAAASGETARKVTRAPKPAEHAARGATGQFEVRPDTTNFAAFEKLAAKQAAK